MASKKELPIVTDRKRGVYLCVYDMQGGPIPSDVEFMMNALAERIKDIHSDLAINTSAE